MTPRLLRANGIDIHCLRTGGDKPPLVMLHGLTASGACWSPQARALAGEHDVVMPDARGHGQSGTPPTGYRYDELAQDVVELIRALGLRAPILLGHSMGGMTAAAVAAREPRVLGGLVLVDPTFLSPQRQREVFESDVAAQHRRLLAQDLGEVIADLQRRHGHRAPEMLELIARARWQTRLQAFEVLTPPNPDHRKLVRRVEVPTLLVIGDAGIVSMEAAKELQALNPRIEIALIEGAGHAIPYDQPERFEAAIRPFLRRVVAGD